MRRHSNPSQTTCSASRRTPLGTTPTHAAPGSSSGPSVASPLPDRHPTTCARGYSATSSWRRLQSADATGCVRRSSTAPTSMRSRDSRRSTSLPLSGPVRSSHTFIFLLEFSGSEMQFFYPRKYNSIQKVKASAGRSLSSRGSSSIPTPGGQGGAHSDYEDKRILVRPSFARYPAHYDKTFQTPADLPCSSRRWNAMHTNVRSLACWTRHPSQAPPRLVHPWM